MPIKLIQGSLFTTECEVIAHGCNTTGGFGSGVAGQIAKRWPRVRDAYLKKYNSEAGWKLGDIQLVYSTDMMAFPVIANIATQEKFGYDGALYADYQAIEKGFTRVLRYCDNNGYSVAAPRVGCGLAGGDWNTVFDILVEVSAKYENVLIEVYSL